jgi:hypothetical protein
MAKKEKDNTNPISKGREDLLECIGKICFVRGEEIIVKVDKEQSPECAKLLSDMLFENHRVRFDIGATEVTT